MSVIFIPFILRVPAGVGIYWITTNLWTIGQQGIVKRTMGHHFPVVQKEEKQKHAQQSRSSRNPPKADAAKADGAKPAAKPAAKKPAGSSRKKRR
jgi:membrane protein insertase Oxa1/YidC/SpoIIIJ